MIPQGDTSFFALVLSNIGDDDLIIHKISLPRIYET